MPKRANGEGTIGYVKSERRWRARITVHTSSGPKRKSFSGKTRGEARRKMMQALSEYDGKVLPSFDVSRISLDEYLALWLSSVVRPNVAEMTYESYEGAVRVHLIPRLGSVKLAELAPAHMRALKSDMLLSGLSAATVSRIQGVLSNALNDAVSDGLINENPCRRVRKAKDREVRIRSLSLDDCRLLLASAESHLDGRYYAMFLFALKTGMRRGEIRALKWEDVDFSRRRISVRRSAAVLRGRVIYSVPKNGEERTISVGEGLLSDLGRHKKKQARDRLATSHWEEEGLVFPSVRGKVVGQSVVQANFKAVLHKALLPETFRFHDLRHTAATLMLQNGIDVRTVSDILGHKDPAITLRRYAHVLPGMQEKASRVMDGMFA